MGTSGKKPKIPIEQQIGFIEEFEKVSEVYVEFAKLIEEILNKAVKSLSILAIVQARPKNIVSFSNKIISKDKYQNPLEDMTDLCGGRVIVHFQSEVVKICDFIKENFEIDEVNSLDLKSKLKVNEFGYRSVHYIITPKKDSILGVEIDSTFKTLKAEIQVRTLAEHVWADISHDRIYKTDLIIPDEWKREAARLSAMLENADKAFAGMSAQIDSLANVYELQYESEKAEADIKKLKALITVLQNNPEECIKNSLKLSAIYRAMDNFPDAVELLKPMLKSSVENAVLKGRLQFEYGMVLALSCYGDIHTSSYAEGLKILDRTMKVFSDLPENVKKENKEALGYLYYRVGKLLQRNEEESQQVADYLTIAHSLMPENPLYLVALMESLVTGNKVIGKFNIGLFEANIRHAIPELQELIEIGIKRVPAWFAIGHCHLFLDDETGCINAFANAIETLFNNKYLTSRATVVAELTLVGKFKGLNPKLSEMVKLYLNIAMYLTTDGAAQDRYKTSLLNYRNRQEPFKAPVVIVAGGASEMDKSKIADFRPYIAELMHGFRGTIISGGTTAGIPGLVGQVKEEMEQNAPVDFELLAYLPEKIPEDVYESNAYNPVYNTDSDTFSALDVLVCWADLINNGIKPEDVILIGIDGGKIAGMEYRIALSLGARVGLIAYSGREVTEFVQDKIWKNHPNLLLLPNDPLTVWALVNQSAETLLTNAEIEELAIDVHDFYRKQQLLKFKPDEKIEDINKLKVVMEWEYLEPSLKKSNLKQVAFYEHMLKRVGLSIRKAGKPVIVVMKDVVSDENYNFLAKLEHARWNAERLLDGWRYGQDKDLVKKLNPCIVPWENLDIETRKYDFDPVDNIPMLLAKIGYEVYKI
jgi:ppGpp synthetase/RelA/SpoT-type nucleotidyltranferase